MLLRFHLRRWRYAMRRRIRGSRVPTSPGVEPQTAPLFPIDLVDLVDVIELHLPANARGDASRGAMARALVHLEERSPQVIQVLWMRLVEGRTDDQVAERLRISPRTVRRHFLMTRAFLRGALSGGSDDQERLVAGNPIAEGPAGSSGQIQ